MTVGGHDDENDPVGGTTSASATVTYADVAPSISVTKLANVTNVEEGGVGNQSVTYTYTIKNTSSASTDPVTLSSVSDDKLGNLLSNLETANGGGADAGSRGDGDVPEVTNDDAGAERRHDLQQHGDGGRPRR